MKLPVRIITPSDVSEIIVPGLTTEISQGGMALYGGVPLQPGDLMEVEFQTSKRLRVAASVRDRNGYYFGLEFLGLLPSDSAKNTGPDFSEMPDKLGKSADSLIVPAGAARMEDRLPSPQEDETLALFLARHEEYLRERELEITRLRYEIQEVRQSRREIELLILRQVLGRSG